MATGDLPVLVGVGQITDPWRAGDRLEAAPSALSLATHASQRVEKPAI